MRRKLKAFICAALGALTLFMVAGCASTRELNELVIVMGVGMDVDNETPGNMILIAEIVLPGKISSSDKGGSSSDTPYSNMDSSAANTFEAIREFTHMVSGKLYTAHAEIFVIGREMAERGISPNMDFFVRAKETRPTSKIVVSDTTARDALDVNPS